MYLDLTYFNSLKQKLDFDSEELFGLQGGNLVDYLLFLMSIIYVGSGTDCRKISHCWSAAATKYERKHNPQQVHKDLLEKWSADAEVGITQFCSNSSKDESGLFESFLIIFLKYYKYNIANINHGSMCYKWRNQSKLVSLNLGYLISYKIYLLFINTTVTPIKLKDIKYKPRRKKYT